MKTTRRSLIRTVMIMTVFNTIISYIIGLGYMKYTGSIDGFWGISYVGITSLSHLFLMTNVPLLTVLPILLLFPRKKLINALTVFLFIAFFFYFYADMVAYGQYRFHINKFIINLLIKGGKGVFYFDTVMYLIMAGIVAFLAFLEIFLYRLSERLTSYSANKLLKKVYITMIALYAVSNVMYAGASAYYYVPITKHNRMYPLYFPLTANRFLQSLDIIDYDKNRSNLANAGVKKSGVVYPKNQLQYRSTDSIRKNILLICIDSWRFDCMTEDVTPNICEMSKNAQVFREHYSGSNGTRGGIFSMFYGLPSSYWDDMKSNCISPVIMDRLQDSGYDFGIYSSATLLAPAFDKTVFAKFKDIETQTHGSRPSEGDRIITDKFKQYIQSKDSADLHKPFFGFVFYDAAHGYDYPNDFKPVFEPTLKSVNYLKLSNDYDPIPFFNRYRNAVNYIDGLIGEITELLKDKGLLENTVVVITGDHSQEFNDNKKNYWGHNGNFSKYQIKIPLVVYDADMGHKEYSHRTSHFDLVPTMMSKYLGCTNPVSDYCMGKDLFNGISWDYLLSGSYMKFGVLHNDMIITKYNSGDYELTDDKLNPMDSRKIDYEMLSKIFKQMSEFYK